MVVERFSRELFRLAGSMARRLAARNPELYKFGSVLRAERRVPDSWARPALAVGAEAVLTMMAERNRVCILLLR